MVVADVVLTVKFIDLNVKLVVKAILLKRRKLRIGAPDPLTGNFVGRRIHGNFNHFGSSNDENDGAYSRHFVFVPAPFGTLGKSRAPAHQTPQQRYREASPGA